MIGIIAVLAVGGFALARARSIPPPKPPLAVFVGDSYAAGTGASSAAHRWANLVAVSEGWRIRNLALGGTGYLATSAGPGCGRPHCTAFEGVLGELQTLDPDIVIVSGGRNDTTYPATAVSSAIDAFFPALRRAAPHARLVAVSPIWDASDPPRRLSEISGDVRSAVLGVQGVFLPVGEPLHGHPGWLAADGLHPSDRGHRAIADAVLRTLPKSLAGGPR